MSFCTAINCMDGRVQIPVIKFLQDRFGTKYVDVITEPGPNRILDEESDGPQALSILARLDISVKKHGSRGIAVVGHYDCAGNPSDQATQERQTRTAVDMLRLRYGQTEVIGLWVDESWRVVEIA